MGVRTWLLRRAMGRLRISDDIVRHLSTFQRLGETVEVQLPTEVLPVGARTVLRALRTRAAAQLGPDWVWPYWLERQIDPRDPAFVPRGHLPFLANLTNRNWTMVGNVASPWEAIVDPRGLVTPWYDGWSLDWWVGADDRWHVPSRDAGVRQRLLDAAPVVETAMRFPSRSAARPAWPRPRSSSRWPTARPCTSRFHSSPSEGRAGAVWPVDASSGCRSSRPPGCRQVPRSLARGGRRPTEACASSCPTRVWPRRSRPTGDT